MCRNRTSGAALTHKHQIRLLSVLALVAGLRLDAQTALKPDWRPIGNAAIEVGLAGPGTGPVARVWFSDEGDRLYIRSYTGQTFVSADLESWTPAKVQPPAPEDLPVAVRPEGFVRARGRRTAPSKIYAFGQFVYRSEDGGKSWANLTGYRGASIIGLGPSDLAVSPRDEDELVVATASGVWRSADGGQSWSGLNQSLPNLPVRRILGFPADTRGVRVAVEQANGQQAFEWAPGEKQAWREVQDDALNREAEWKRTLGEKLRARITAVAASQDGVYLYAGSADGQLWASSDRGVNWRRNPDAAAAPVEQISIDPRDPRLALAALGPRLADVPATVRAQHVIRILNGGGLWDDLTANLPDIGVNGIAADRATGAVYIATDRGLYLAFEDLLNAAPAAPWVPLGEALPEAPATDVKLDPAGNQVYAAIDGFGVFAAPAPHRARDIRLVSSADLAQRAAAPGALLSVLGANVRSVQSGALPVPVLAASDSKTEIQVPFEARGTSLALAIESAGGSITVGVPLQSAAPAIFVDRDGSPVLLDADSGVMLDAMKPARSNSRLQLLAAGLGRVRPEWPTGTPAPVDNPPRVAAAVRAYLDRQPVEVTRAVLAPGYIGFYLIEIQLPKLVNYGPAELYIEADGQPSNRVRVYIEP